VPKNIEEMILAVIEGKQEAAILTNNTPNPFAPIGQNQRYYTLSGGLFDEMHPKADTAEYFHALLNTKTKRIIGFTPLDTSGNSGIDPVVFALSVEPLAAMLPSYSPYAAFNDNPVLFVDPTGAYSELGAWWRNALHSGNGIYQSGKEWGYNKKTYDKDGKQNGWVAHFGNSGQSKTKYESILANEENKSQNWEIGTSGNPTGKGAVEENNIIFNTIFTVGTLGLGGAAEGAASEVIEEAGGEAATDATTQEAGKYFVYEAVDPETNTVKYVGITSRNVAIRETEHKAAKTAFQELTFERVAKGLTKTDARIIEQKLINQYGMESNGGTLLNKINSIAPKNWAKYGIK